MTKYELVARFHYSGPSTQQHTVYCTLMHCWPHAHSISSAHIFANFATNTHFKHCVRLLRRTRGNLSCIFHATGLLEESEEAEICTMQQNVAMSYEKCCQVSCRLCSMMLLYTLHFSLPFQPIASKREQHLIL